MGVYTYVPMTTQMTIQLTIQPRFQDEMGTIFTAPPPSV